MVDLIERQAAIDAAALSAAEWDGMYVQDINGRIRKALEKLPSAQPEIIRCKDCKHYHTDVCGSELGIGGMYENIIVAHDACDRWTKGMNCVEPEGFCFLAERNE